MRRHKIRRWEAGGKNSVAFSLLFPLLASHMSVCRHCIMVNTIHYTIGWWVTAAPLIKTRRTGEAAALTLTLPPLLVTNFSPPSSEILHMLLWHSHYWKVVLYLESGAVLGLCLFSFPIPRVHFRRIFSLESIVSCLHCFPPSMSAHCLFQQ